MPVVLRRLVGTVFCGPHLPARRKILGLCLGDALPDDFGFRGAKLLDELLELRLGEFVQPQHEAPIIGAGFKGALLGSALTKGG
jgi:hypothetical protein